MHAGLLSACQHQFLGLFALQAIGIHESARVGFVNTGITRCGHGLDAADEDKTLDSTLYFLGEHVARSGDGDLVVQILVSTLGMSMSCRVNDRVDTRGTAL